MSDKKDEVRSAFLEKVFKFANRSLVHLPQPLLYAWSDIVLRNVSRSPPMLSLVSKNVTV